MSLISVRLVVYLSDMWVCIYPSINIFGLWVVMGLLGKSYCLLFVCFTKMIQQEVVIFLKNSNAYLINFPFPSSPFKLRPSNSLCQRENNGTFNLWKNIKKKIKLVPYAAFLSLLLRDKTIHLTKLVFLSAVILFPPSLLLHIPKTF